jgi:DNA-binding response OmpR family regulator
MVNAGKEREMRKRILVIDDDHEVRSLIQTLLEEEAYEVETAIDGVDAFEHLDHQWSAYEVILLDLTMPRLGGLPFLQKIQEHDEALRQSAGMGIGNTLSKPFDLDVLLSLVGGVRGGSEKQTSVRSC